MIKVYALDDQRDQLDFLEMNIGVYNSKQEDEKDKIDLRTETEPQVYLDKMDESFDVALIDIDLKRPDINGFNIAQKLYDKFGSKIIYIMCSSLVTDKEEYESLLSKSFRNIAAELVSRFQELKLHRLENRAQLLFSQDDFTLLAHV